MARHVAYIRILGVALYPLRARMTAIRVAHTVHRPMAKTSRRMHGIFGELERAHNDCMCTSHPSVFTTCTLEPRRLQRVIYSLGNVWKSAANRQSRVVATIEAEEAVASSVFADL